MQKRCTVDLWTAGYAGSRLTAPAQSPMDKPWTTLRVAHRLPTGRRLPTSSTALKPIVIKSGKVKTKTPAPALAYSSPVAVQTTGTTAARLHAGAPLRPYNDPATIKACLKRGLVRRERNRLHVNWARNVLIPLPSSAIQARARPAVLRQADRRPGCCRPAAEGKPYRPKAEMRAYLAGCCGIAAPVDTLIAVRVAKAIRSAAGGEP